MAICFGEPQAQLEEALSKNIPYMVIIGSKEVEEGMVTVKDLQVGLRTLTKSSFSMNIKNFNAIL